MILKYFYNFIKSIKNLPFESYASENENQIKGKNALFFERYSSKNFQNNFIQGEIIYMTLSYFDYFK